MARVARIVVPGIPHHVTQRGNRRQPVFFSDSDRIEYLRLMAEWCRLCGVEIWAYCLMPNHVHLVAVPEGEESLARGIGEAHRRHTRRVNFSRGWKGYLWQGRFASFPMDEPYLLAAVRYVELNPVRARLVRRASEYSWSSVRAHLEGKDDGLVRVRPVLDRVSDWRGLLATGDEQGFEEFRKHQRTGRPLGDADFAERISRLLGRNVSRKKPGPKPRGS